MTYALDINPTNFPPARITNLATILNVFIPLLMTAGVIFFLAMLIYAAITFTTAGGNAEKTKKAQKILFSAIFGLIIVISAFLIVKIIEFILQINIPI